MVSLIHRVKAFEWNGGGADLSSRSTPPSDPQCRRVVGSETLNEGVWLEQLPAPNQKVQRDFDEAVERVVQAALDAVSRQSPEQLRANAVERSPPQALQVLIIFGH